MSLDCTLKTTGISHLNSLGGSYLSKLTLHPKQTIHHYEDGDCFAVTTIVWESSCADWVQLHQEYYSKCTANRLAHINDCFDDVKDLLREQGITKLITYSTKCDRKMKKYWSLLGFAVHQELDGVWYSWMEI